MENKKLTMTDADLNRIAASLGIELPKDYAALMRSRAEELGTLTHTVEGTTYPLFGETLYLNVDKVIDINMLERQSDSAIGHYFPGWWQSFILIGTNGGGAYYCLRLDGDRKVLFISTDFDKPYKTHNTLADYVNEYIPSVYSSFDTACPLAERFSFYFGFDGCAIQCREVDRPLTEEKLRHHGIDLEELRRSLTRAVAVLVNREFDALMRTSCFVPMPNGILAMGIPEPPVSDPRVRPAFANAFGGVTYVIIPEAQDKTPPPDMAGIDWTALQESIKGILKALYPPQTTIVVSKVQESIFKNAIGQWMYEIPFSLG